LNNDAIKNENIDNTTQKNITDTNANVTSIEMADGNVTGMNVTEVDVVEVNATQGNTTAIKKVKGKTNNTVSDDTTTLNGTMNESGVILNDTEIIVSNNTIKQDINDSKSLNKSTSETTTKIKQNTNNTVSLNETAVKNLINNSESNITSPITKPKITNKTQSNPLQNKNNTSNNTNIKNIEPSNSTEPPNTGKTVPKKIKSEKKVIEEEDIEYKMEIKIPKEDYNEQEITVYRPRKRIPKQIEYNKSQQYNKQPITQDVTVAQSDIKEYKVYLLIVLAAIVITGIVGYFLKFRSGREQGYRRPQLEDDDSELKSFFRVPIDDNTI
jgi:hypothetical protein